jgi:Fe-S-cluster-containing dehydrogenase component
MTELALWVDVSRCIGCYSCELACKQENDVAVGSRWIRVVQVGPREIGGRLRLDFVPMACMHCGKPACQSACPEDAISKRSDGIVVVDADLCTGCKACIQSCKFGAMQFNPEREVAEKCTLCLHRLQRGLPPSCVLNCPTGALVFGDINRASEAIRNKRASFLASFLAE